LNSSKKPDACQASLTERLGEHFPGGEADWVDVIRKMDEVYADLLHYQSQLQRQNAALENAHQFIDNVLSAMPDVLIVCDNRGTILQVNRALENLTGQSEQYWLKQPLSALFYQDRPVDPDFFIRQFRGQTRVDCEVTFADRDGKPAVFSVNCSPHYHHNGRLEGTVLIGRAIGELRRAYDSLNATVAELTRTQQQLVHAEKMASLGRLVAGVAHELNNPISFIYGNMHAFKQYGQRIGQYLRALDDETDEAARRQLRGELKIDRILEQIEPLIEGTLEGTIRVSEIVQELRGFSGKQKEPKSRFDLPKHLQTACDWVVKANRKTPPHIDYQMPEHLEVLACKGYLHQIVINLLQNAVDILEHVADPRLTVACGQNDSEIWVSIRDNGPGIDPTDLGKVFEPFYTTKPVGKGTGLGLYISYGLAQDQGGELKAANHPEGGAVFTLSLPRDEQS
jgi:two-component system sensor histidine kinase HupT/HoxJ